MTRFKPLFSVLLLAALAISASSLSFLHPKFRAKVMSDSKTASSMDCIICTTLTLLSENYATSHNVSVDDFIEHKLCTFFKTPLNTFCQNFVTNYGPQIIDSLSNDTNPDHACQHAGLCANPQCQLVPNKTKFDITFNDPITRLRIAQEKTLNLSEVAVKWDPAQELYKIIAEFGTHHSPDVDFDNDTFAEYVSYTRGYNWKGKDCNDFNPNIYPGRRANTSSDASVDNNCNGIYGINETTGVSWEETLCSGTNELGFAVIGDSVGAHFEIPWQWLNATVWNSTTFDDFVPRGLNEFDLPYLSGFSGHLNSTMGLPSNSLYKYLYQHNQCNFRDYQNAGVDGADSNLEQSDIRDAFKRNQATDKPMLVVLELVGNDVCHGPEPWAMTSTEQFQKNILDLLSYLDTQLPAGSHVISVGLVNQHILYQNLSTLLHPIGVTYGDFYDYLDCLNISPCPGWLTSNATARNITETQAHALNQVYHNITAMNLTWNNFDWVYHDFPDMPIIIEWINNGGEPWQLIEPVDGFHPNQIFNSLLADYFWNWISTNYSDWLGAPNPNNALISQLFGDQGGY